MLKLKLQYFGHLMPRANSLENALKKKKERKGLDSEKDWRQEEKGKTGWDGWMASPTPWPWVWAGSGSCWWTGRPGMLQFMGSWKLDMTEWLNWTELNIYTKRMDLRLCIFTTKIKNNKKDGRKLWEVMGMSMALVVIVSYMYIPGIFHIPDLSPTMETMISIAVKDKLHFPPLLKVTKILMWKSPSEYYLLLLLLLGLKIYLLKWKTDRKSWVLLALVSPSLPWKRFSLGK